MSKVVEEKAIVEEKEVVEEKTIDEKVEEEMKKSEISLPEISSFKEKIRELKRSKDYRIKILNEGAKEECVKIDETHREAVRAEKEEVRENVRILCQQIKDNCAKAITKWEEVIEAQIDIAKREKEAEIRAEMEDTKE